MSEPINFVVTNVGLNALLNAQTNGFKLSLNKVGLGSGQYTATADRTAMAAKFTENTISAGGIEEQAFTLRFTMIMNYNAQRNVSELGIYTDTGVLFAVASKPAGKFFTLYQGIDYVANFGLVLHNTDAIASIQVIVDGRAGIATQLMNDHLLAPDPHPQYKQYANAVLQQHLNEPDPHPQYALKTFLAEETLRLDKKINNLLELTEYFFPPLLMAGYGTTSDVVTPRKKGANYTFLDSALVYLFCPENTHEAWSTARDASLIRTNVFNRSGTNRIGYSGLSGWVVIDTERTLFKKGFFPMDTQLENEIKCGVFEAGQGATIYKGAGETLDYTDPNVVLLISPEGAHEAWDISRNANAITIGIFNRSGTNRIGYSGRVNWALFKADSVPNTKGKFPRHLIAGTAYGSDFTIPAPAGMDFSDPNYLPFITPEGGHEAWTITRSPSGFRVNIFGRSGQNRIGYSGRVNWAVFAINKPVRRQAYFAGQHQIVIEAGRSAVISLFGAGGGGGGAIHNYSSRIWNIPSNGGKGGDSVLSYNGTRIVAGGGGGGGGANWGNGSAFSNGVGGVGGSNAVDIKQASFGLLVNQNGNTAIIGSRWERQQGGVPTSLSSGQAVTNAGGLGAWGVGDEKWSYGGGGGSGGFVEVEFENTSNQNVVLTLDIGNAGIGWKPPTSDTKGNSGENGGPAFAVVSYAI